MVDKTGIKLAITPVRGKSATEPAPLGKGKNIASAPTMPGIGDEPVLTLDETTIQMSNTMIGQEVGSYRIIDVLGEGGMGRVYLAEHIKIGRRVALKMLHSHLAGSPDVVRRFFDEARAVNRILHDHIVEITDFIENEEGNNYFIMEHLRGMPLVDLVVSKDGNLTLARALGIGVQIASALSAVHTAQIVHRDLKPENVFLTERGGQKDFVKLLDFGIAKLMGEMGDGIKLQETKAGMIMGTPEYMSPEQASGTSIDHRTDIYSLGVILYELCTGAVPFVAADFGDLIVMLKTQTPVTPSKTPDLLQPIPAPLDKLILDCLAKDPANRPQSTKEVEERLRAIATEFAVELEHFSVSGSSKRKAGSSRRQPILLAAVAIAAAVTLTLFLSGGKDTPATTAVPPVVAAATKPVLAPVLPAPKASVSISFTSEPTGAEVFAQIEGGEASLLGVTPLTRKFEPSEAARRFEFRLEGFKPAITETAAGKGGELSTKLVPLDSGTSPLARKRKRLEARKAAKARRDKQRKNRFKEGAVMNPFDN